MSTIRRLKHIAREDANPGSGGRRHTFGYGIDHLCKLGGTDPGRVAPRGSVYRAMKARGIPLHEPAMAVAWALARHGKKAEAATILKVFGYSNFEVKYKSIRKKTTGC